MTIDIHDTKYPLDILNQQNVLTLKYGQLVEELKWTGVQDDLS